VVAHLGRAGIPAQVVPSLGRVGGGSAPALSLEGWAVTLPEAWAAPLRLGDPAVLARVQGGRTVLDLRALEARQDAVLVAAVQAAAPAGDATARPARPAP
jgi:L-seryl-tRNA(Ser) seleniumtransferase